MNRIKDSWNKITLNKKKEKEILNDILNRTHSNQKNMHNFGIKRIIPIAICIILITGMFYISNIVNKKAIDANPANHSIKGLPVENFSFADIDLGDGSMDRIGFHSFGDFFEYGVDMLAFVKVSDTKQHEWKSPDNSNQQEVQTSTVHIIDTIWNNIDAYPSSFEITQAIYGGCIGTEKTNLLRKDGVYLLPLIQSDGEWGLMGGLDVLFEIDDNGYVWSHASSADFKYYDGMNVNKFAEELHTMIHSDNYLMVHSKFGNLLKSWSLLDITITSKTGKKKNKDRYKNYEYNFIVNEVFFSYDHWDPTNFENVGYITDFIHQKNKFKFQVGERYLLFLDKYEGLVFANSAMISRINNDGTITAIPAEDASTSLGASVFIPYNGFKVSKIREMVEIIKDWHESIP